VTSVDRTLDRFDRIAVGAAAGIFLGSLLTNPIGHALAGRVAYAVASAIIAYAVAWAVLR